MDRYKSLGEMRSRSQSIVQKDGWEASWIDFASRHYGKDLDWIYHYDVEQSIDKLLKQD